MVTDFSVTQDGIQLHLHAENALESIALKAWIAQAEKMDFGRYDSMPARFMLIHYPVTPTA